MAELQDEDLEQPLVHNTMSVATPEDEGADAASALSKAGLSEDVGELDFTYDDTLLQADEEEEAALSETLHKESQEPESERSKQEQYERNWGSSSANALPVQKIDVPAHSRAGLADHTDRQRMFQRPRPPRPNMPSRIDIDKREYPQRGRGHMQMQGAGSRYPDGHRGPPVPSGPAMRHQGVPDRPVASSHSRPGPSSAQPPEAMEFDPQILWNAIMPPSFAPLPEDANHNKRTHDQMQSQLPSIPEDLMRSLLQMQQPQHPSAQGNLLHQGIRSGVPPPRPPSGPPPAGPPPMPHSRHRNMMSGFGGVPDFSPMTSNSMDYQSFEAQQQMPRPGQSGWSLSHGMDGAGRPNSQQEPTLAAGMVWNDANAAPSFSGREQPNSQADHLRHQIPGQRSGLPRPAMPPQGPRPPLAKSPPSTAPIKPSQDALAAAKAKFEQQQKENEKIAEMNKRQRLGLPMEHKPVPETEIEKLKRKIAEKEAAVKVAQAQMAAAKSAPSAAHSRPSSASPSPSPNAQQPRVQTTAVHAEHAEAAERAEPSGRGRPTEASPGTGRSSGHRRHSRDRSRDANREKSRRDDGRSSHARQNGGSNSHSHRSHETRQRDRSRDRTERQSHREHKDNEAHRSPQISSTQQALQAAQHSHSRSPMSGRQHARHGIDVERHR